MQITLTDQIVDNTATLEAEDIVTTITPWFPEAPADVIDAIHLLQTAVMQGVWVRADELAQSLGLRLTR